MHIVSFVVHYTHYCHNKFLTTSCSFAHVRVNCNAHNSRKKTLNAVYFNPHSCCVTVCTLFPTYIYEAHYMKTI